MPNAPKTKDVTIRGGKNVAAPDTQPEKPSKAKTTNPKEKTPTPDPEPKKSDQ